jgi:hypothetical protein
MKVLCTILFILSKHFRTACILCFARRVSADRWGTISQLQATAQGVLEIGTDYFRCLLTALVI